MSWPRANQPLWIPSHEPTKTATVASVTAVHPVTRASLDVELLEDLGLTADQGAHVCEVG